MANTYKIERLQKILLKVEEKFQHRESAEWKNSDFKDLSFEVLKATRVSISSGTLKRIFGKVKTDDEYYPQAATIDALINYSGYEEDGKEVQPILNEKPKKKRIVLISFFFLIAISLFLYFMQDKPKEIPVASELKLLKIDGSNPATVYFDYRIQDIKDSVFFDFGDNPDFLNVQKQAGQISHYYRYPGKFSAKLQIRSKQISNTVDLYIPTEGWQALAYYFQQKDNERYFPVPFEENCKDGVFHPSAKTLGRLGMDTTRIVVVRVDNYQKTKSSGDNFILESRFKNDSFWPAIRCYSAFFTVRGEHGRIFLKFVNDGCSIHCEQVISEKYRNGSSCDLTNFSVDIKKWRKLRVENQNQHVLVYSDEELILDETYEKPLGNIVGASVSFHGIGSLDYFHLNDSLGQSVFCEDFGD